VLVRFFPICRNDEHHVSCLAIMLRRLTFEYQLLRCLPCKTQCKHTFCLTSGLELKRRVRLVNTDTLLSLQIIQSENHPNSHNQGPTKGSSGAKEGLSLYGLFFQFAHTTQGRQMLRQYFLRPSTNIDMIRERLHAVTVLTRPDNEVVLASVCKRLRAVKDVRKLIAKLQKGAAGGTSKGGGIARSIWSGLQKVC